MKWGIGVDNVDFEACKTLGIPITNTPGMFGGEVADALVRLECHPKLMGEAVKTAGEASAMQEAFCQQPDVSRASAEPLGLAINARVPIGSCRSAMKSLLSINTPKCCSSYWSGATVALGLAPKSPLFFYWASG